MRIHQALVILFLMGLYLSGCRQDQGRVTFVEVTRVVKETQLVVIERMCSTQDALALKEDVDVMCKEVNYRLHEIHTFLDQEPINKGAFYNATARSTAHGVGISIKYKDAELKTLLFELELRVPEEDRPDLQHIRVLFEELAELGPQAPFSDGDPADPQNVLLARETLGQIELEWTKFLEKLEKDNVP